MNQEQFGQFWAQLKASIKAKWVKITEEGLAEILEDLGTSGTVLQRQYGGLQLEGDVTWANRRYSHWSGNYEGCKDAEPAS
jgi:hypothetical protein